MTLIGGWLLVPHVFALLCTGIGLLAERLARQRVTGALLPGVGLAGLIVLAGLLTLLDATAELAAPACALAAVAGFVVGRPWRDPRLRAAWPWALGAAGLAFAIVAAPSLLSGQGSVLGYIKLDDSAIWLGLISHFMEHGRDIGGVPPSTFRLDLELWLDQGYPIGSFTPVGVVATLTGQEYVNAYQPVISCFVAVLALGLFALARELLGSPRAAAAVAVVGVQASLFYGYVAWGSIKEICFAALLPVLVGLRSLPLAALTGGALICAFGVGGAVFVGPALLAVLIVARARWRPLAAAAVVFAVSVVPVLAVLGINARITLDGSPSAQQELGKLDAPLAAWQGAGLWPVGDFRAEPDPYGVAVALALLGLGLAAVAAGWALRRRRWTLPALLFAVLLGGAVAIARGAPWIDAKVLAMAAPMLLAAAAIAALMERRQWVVAAVLVAGCAWSTFLINRDVYVAPRDSLREQRAFAELLDGRGPALMLDYEGYSTRYLLGPAAIEGATDLRVSLIPGLDGEPFPDYTTVEVDAVQTDALLAFRTLVRRVTPTGSRPPSPFRPLRAGRFFEAWERDRAAPAPLEHLPRGEGILPAAQVTCREIDALAATPGTRTLAAVPRSNPVVAALTEAELPVRWRQADGTVRPVTDGTARVELQVPAAGRYRVFVGGQALGSLAVAVDGEPAGSVRHQLDAAVGYLRFGAVELGAGPHVVSLRYRRGGFWRAGRGRAQAQLALGPVALAPTGVRPIERVPVADAERLCDGRTYDWLEALP